MTALLEVPAIRRQTTRLSVQDFHRLGEGLRAELLEGILINKMPKSPLHQFTVERLRRILSTQIDPAWILRQEGPMTFVDSEPEPDLAIAPAPEDAYRFHHPHTAALVVEVAISSLEIDRVKAHIYAEARIPEYWIVCPEEKSVEVYRQPSPEGYAAPIIFTAPAVIHCAVLPGVSVDLAALFA